MNEFSYMEWLEEVYSVCISSGRNAFCSTLLPDNLRSNGLITRAHLRGDIEKIEVCKCGRTIWKPMNVYKQKYKDKVRKSTMKDVQEWVINISEFLEEHEKDTFMVKGLPLKFRKANVLQRAHRAKYIEHIDDGSSSVHTWRLTELGKELVN